MRFSLEGKLAAWSVVLALIAIGIYAAVYAWLGSILISALASAIVIAPIGMIAARSFTRPIVDTVGAIGDGIASMKDRDFSMSIAPSKQYPSKEAVVYRIKLKR